MTPGPAGLADRGAVVPFGEDAGLDLSGVSDVVASQVVARLLGKGYEAWAQTASRVGHCTRPIRLRGSSTTVDIASGEVLSSYRSTDEPLGALHVRCGNRREAVCPSCSRVYAADTFHLIRAGVAGGKTVPKSVGDNPLVFATLTAPGFGPVHGIRPLGARCRPRDRATRCLHGRRVACMTAHAEGDELVGQPLCVDCYDYETHVIWQWWAPELWRRFTIALRRAVAAALGVPAKNLRDIATVQYAKVAEFQVRGVVHFHALIRLDGPRTAGGFATAPAGMDATGLAHAVRGAVAGVEVSATPAFDVDPGRDLRFGTQVDARPVTASRRTDHSGQGLTAEQVAGYIAKYATKSAADTTDVARGNRHLRRIKEVAADLGAIARQNRREAPLAEPSPYLLLGKWVHMLGFRGHFSTKSRGYSVTLGRLRRARRRWHVVAEESRRTGTPVDVAELEARLMADEEEAAATLVIGDWSFVGTGWQTAGDVALARAAAARAREQAQWRAQHRSQNTRKEGRCATTTT
jgi:hypothetical protein